MADATSSLRSSQAKLDQLQAGATQADLTASQAAFDKAQAEVLNAKIKLDQTKATALLPPDVIQAQSALAAAERSCTTHIKISISSPPSSNRPMPIWPASSRR